RRNERVAEYLPETRPCTDTAQLIPFMRKYRSVYLKMAGGSLGKGTARVELLEGDRFRWRATRGGRQMVSRTLRGRRALQARLIKLRQGRPYLMQQAVSLLREGNRPFDIRALLQKD